MTRRARLWRGGCGSAGGLLVVTIVVGLLLPGCSVGYVTRQSFSHMRVLAARERSPRADLEALGWQIAQDLAAMPARAAVVYPSHYRRAVVG